MGHSTCAVNTLVSSSAELEESHHCDILDRKTNHNSICSLICRNTTTSTVLDKVQHKLTFKKSFPQTVASAVVSNIVNWYVLSPCGSLSNGLLSLVSSRPVTDHLFCKQVGSMRVKFAYHFSYFSFSDSGQCNAGSHYHQAAWQHRIPNGLPGEKPRGCV